MDKKKYIKNIIKEELTKTQVNSMISDKMSGYVRKNELEGKIKEVVADVMAKFFRSMYNKKNMWQGDVKNG